MTDDFNPWRPSDLVRFLRTYGELSDAQHTVCTADVQTALGITKPQALSAHRRVVALGLLEEIEGAPHRLTDGVEDFQSRLTGDGMRAVLNDRLPDIQ